MEKNANITNLTRDFILVHIIFIGLCFAVLIIPIPIAIGIKLFILIVSYNLLIPLVGLFRKYSEWIKLWVFVFLISLFQIWPDWFLSAQLNILVFPEDGLFKIGTVSGYMAGLWDCRRINIFGDFWVFRTIYVDSPIVAPSKCHSNFRSLSRLYNYA